MTVKFHGNDIAEIVSGDILVNAAQDVLELMVSKDVRGARKIVLRKENFAPEFYDLSTKLAGDIMQKFVNYRMQVAIVGDFTNISSDSLKALVWESNRNQHIFFAENLDEAIQHLNNN
jgi:hypothetical protein